MKLSKPPSSLPCCSFSRQRTFRHYTAGDISFCSFVKRVDLPQSIVYYSRGSLQDRVAVSSPKAQVAYLVPRYCGHMVSTVRRR